MLANYIMYNENPIVSGWIQSLCELSGQSSELEVGLVYLIDGQYEKRQHDNYTLYLTNFERSKNPLYRIYRNISGKKDHPKWLDNYLRVIDDFQPDIVHIFGTESFIIELLPQIKQRTIVHIQGIVTACMNAWLPPGGYSVLDLYRYSFRFIDYLKGRTQIQSYRLFKKMRKREETNVRHIQYCMGRTDWDRRTIKTMNDGIGYFHIEEVLRNQFYDAKQWKYKKRNKISLISVLSPYIYKGFDLILKSARILKKQGIDFEWIICGTETSDNIVSFFDKKLRLNHRELNIKYMGQVHADKLIEYMYTSDLFIHPSYIENSPNSICEAQLVGMPVIATDVGGISSLIENRKTGILIPANDPYCLVSYIIELTGNENLATEISTNARQAASIRHDRENILNNIKVAYKKILQNKA